MIRLKTSLSIFIIIISFQACSTFKTAIYDHYSYQKTVEIKIDAINLMGKATSPYNENLKEIGELGLEIEKIIEYEKNKPDNEITYKMWQLLADPEKKLLFGFFKEWKERDESQTLNPVFIMEAKKQLTEAFDLLIAYETKKDKTTENQLLQFIN
jgi:hypothetical protein